MSAGTAEEMVEGWWFYGKKGKNLPYGMFPMNTDFEGGLEDIFAKLNVKQCKHFAKGKTGRRKEMHTGREKSKITGKNESSRKVKLTVRITGDWLVFTLGS